MHDLKMAYAKDGFCIARNVLPLEAIEKVQNDFWQLIKNQLFRYKSQWESKSLYEDMQELLKCDTQSYLSTLKRGAKLYSLSQLMGHTNIGKLTKEMGIALPTISAEPVWHISSEKLKIPNGYFGFDAHQDWPSIQGSLDCMVVWVPFTEVHRHRFPMLVLPGSHRRGMIPGVITDNVLKLDLGVDADNKFVPIECKPGDVVLMSCWTVHKTGVENSEGLRISSSQRWENGMEKTFVERNYPCAYKQIVERALITPDFPSTEQVLDVFTRL